jgi:hypothetical protein
MCEQDFHSYRIHGELTICASEASYTPESFINLCRSCCVKVVAFIGLDFFAQREGHAVMQEPLPPPPPMPQAPPIPDHAPDHRAIEDMMRGTPNTDEE